MTVTRIATLGNDYEAPVNEEFTVQRLSDGRYVMSSNTAGGEMHVFRHDGSFLRMLGGSGRGPGEYATIERIYLFNGKLYLFDTTGRRRTVLTQDFDIERIDPIPAHVMSATLVHDSLLVTNMAMRTRDRAGIRLHVLRPDGSFVRSFDEVGDGFRGDLTAKDYRQLASFGGRLYSAHFNEYVIEQFSVDGALARTFVRTVPWFEPWTHRCCTFDPQQPPETTLRDVRFDSAGRLWVLIGVADPDHARWLSPETRPGGEGMYRILNRNGVFDSIIEVIDLEAGVVLGRSRIDPFAHEFADAGHVATYREDGLRVLLDVWRFDLRSPRQ